jgi:alpha-tubulin suppressor-like RCC1 family protein
MAASRRLAALCLAAALAGAGAVAELREASVYGTASVPDDGAAEQTADPLPGTDSVAADGGSAEQTATAAAGGSADADGCQDYMEDCYFWSNVGHCDDNARFMLSRCPLSCGACMPRDPGHPAPLSAPRADGGASPLAPQLVLMGGVEGGTTQTLGLPAGDPIVELSAGEVHLVLRTASGAVFSLGDNSLGQLGRPLAAAREPHTAWRPYRVRWPAPGARAVSVSAGRMHSAAVLDDGQVVAWGDNAHGQCGVAAEMTPLNMAPAELEILDAAVALPARVPLPEHASAVACGELHCLALGRSGAVYAWGDNVYGQLGAKTEHASEGPLRVPVGEAVVALSAAAFHSLALTARGRVLGWGDNTHGQLGDGRAGFVAALLSGDGEAGGAGRGGGGPTEEEFEAEFAVAATPASLPLPLHAGESVLSVCAGAYHSAAVSSHGRLLLWGDNSYGELGAEASNRSEVGESLTATPLGGEPLDASPGGLGGVHASAVAVGEYHTLALSNDSRLFTFGFNGRGQLARTRGVNWDATPAPAELPLPHPHGPGEEDAVALVASGPFFSAAVSAAGHLLVWGEHPTAGVRAARAGGERPAFDGGGRGAAGRGEGEEEEVSGGGEGEAAAAEGGAEVRLGGGGVGTASPRVLAVRVCGFHVLAATRDAAGLALWSWGEDAARQLCRSPPSGMDLDEVPCPLPPLPSGAPPSIFGCGGFHTLVASADQLFRCGEAGDTEGDADRVDEGGDTVGEAEGDDTGGEPDHGWREEAPRPPRISAEHLPGFSAATDAIVQLAGGHVHSLALSSTGRVWAWGSNSHGQLGRRAMGAPGSAAAAAAAAAMQPPLEVSLPSVSSSRVIHVAAGGYHSIAVTADGEVYSWGANSHAQLARPSALVVDPIPARVPLPVTVGAAAGDGIGAARDGTGHTRDEAGATSAKPGASLDEISAATDEISAAGDEPGGGSCAYGSSLDLQTGACVLGGARAVAASAGVHHSLLLLSDGRVCAFGDNSYGQQGAPAASRATACGAAISGGAVQLASGELHAVALSAAGEVYTWGGNSNGQLGRTPALVSPVPGRVPLRLRDGEKAVAVSAGGYRTAVVTSEGRLIMLGRAAASEEGEEEEDMEGGDDGAFEEEEEEGAGASAPAGARVEAPMEGARAQRSGALRQGRAASARAPAGEGDEPLPGDGVGYAAGEEPVDAFAFALEVDIIDW